jgi:hypothetical protein
MQDLQTRLRQITEITLSRPKTYIYGVDAIPEYIPEGETIIITVPRGCYD